MVIFNTRLLFKNNRVLLSGNLRGDKVLMEGIKVVMGGSPH